MVRIFFKAVPTSNFPWVIKSLFNGSNERSWYNLYAGRPLRPAPKSPGLDYFAKAWYKAPLSLHPTDVIKFNIQFFGNCPLSSGVHKDALYL